MEIYDILKTDHQEIKGYIEELLALRDDDDYRYVLIEEIANSLIPHSRAEESVFYNTLRAVNADKNIVLHGYQEHLEAETLLRTLQAMDKMNMNWRKTAEKLRDALYHHIDDEENEIFNEAKSAFTSEEAVGMGEAFNSLKEKVSQESTLQTTVDMFINMMPPRIADSLRKFGDSGART